MLDYQLGLHDVGVVADEIRKVKPQVTVVMLAEDTERSADALKSVDAFVAESDGPYYLLANGRNPTKEEAGTAPRGKAETPRSATSPSLEQVTWKARLSETETLLDWRPV